MSPAALKPVVCHPVPGDALPSVVRQSPERGYRESAMATPATPPSPAFGTASLVLRVLSGPQQGAQAQMRAERLLVGNLEAECDVVLDVGRTPRHACLLRASADGWSVLAIAGDLWIGETPLEPQQSVELLSGQVLTLGEVAFCLADVTTVDWASLVVPSSLQHAKSPHVAGTGITPAHSADHIGHSPAHGGRSGIKTSEARPWRVAKWATAVAAGLVLLALVAGAVLRVAPNLLAAPAVASTQHDRVAAARTLLAGFPWAADVTVQADPDQPRRVLLGGYLPGHSQATLLDAALRQQGIVAQQQWVLVEDLSRDLTRRLDLKPDNALTYIAAGRFTLLSTRIGFAKLDRQLRAVLQETAAIQAIDLQFNDFSNPPEPGVAPLTLHYARSPLARGGVLVRGLEALRAETRYVVREVRHGALPSVVLDDGARYFVGSSLPGNGVLSEIGARHVVVQTTGQQRRIDLDASVQVAGRLQR